MKKLWIFILLTIFLLTSCLTVKDNPTQEAPPLLVTSTLPPTKQGLTLPTAFPPTGTPTLDPMTPSPTVTSPAECRDNAILVEDVTIPDYTSVPRGQKFTKTWKFNNMGRCAWSGYTIAFLSGDRMSSPNSAPVPDTEARATVDVSIDLAAPPNDGTFTGIFELLRKRPQNDSPSTSATTNSFQYTVLILFILFVGFLGLYGCTAQIGAPGTNGGIFPEVMSLFTLRSFGVFYLSIALAVVPFLRDRSIPAILHQSIASYGLILFITAAAFIYIGVFDFAAKPGGFLYFGAYLGVGIPLLFSFRKHGTGA